MATNDTKPSVAPTAAPIVHTGPKWVQVRAVRQGFCPGLDSNGRHYLREVGDLFSVEDRLFSDEWMVKAKDGEALPELPPEPPPTTLPTAPRPVTLS